MIIDIKIKEQSIYNIKYIIYMFIKYTIKQQFILTAQSYTQNPKSVRDAIFIKYLFKIMKIPGVNNSKSAQAICVKIQSIQIIDNILLRKTADMKVKVQIQMIVLRLLPEQYYQGTISQCSSKGIKVKFIGGLLQGTIPIQGMHKDTIYNEDKNQWILAVGEHNTQGYQWKVGAQARFRINYTIWDQPYQGPQESHPSMSDLIILKANEAGLGPIEWWL